MKPRENTEWCRFYWYNTQDTSLPRVLLIGDSIVAGYSAEVAQRLEGKATLAFFSTSKCAGDPGIYRELALAFASYHFAVIHFNNGLHGLENTESDYARGLTDFVDAIEELAPTSKYLWASSTPITVKADPATLDAVKNPRVTARNELALQIMASRSIPVNDLYRVVVNRPELSCGDGYHYNEQGYQALADQVSKMILAALI